MVQEISLGVDMEPTGTSEGQLMTMYTNLLADMLPCLATEHCQATINVLPGKSF